MCDEIFTDFGNLSVHTTAIHSYNRTFQSDTCNKSFKEQSNLNVHVSSSHSKHKTI